MRDHLVFKVVLVLIVSIVLLTSVVGVLLFHSEKTKAIEALTVNSAQTADRLSNALVDPLWNVNKEQIDTIIALEMANTNISAIVLDTYFGDHSLLGKMRSADSEVVSLTSDHDVPPSVHSGFITATRTLIRENKNIGSLTIAYSDHNLQADLQKLVLDIFGLTSLLAAIIVLVLFLSIRLVVLKPLFALEKVVRRMGEHDFALRVPVNSTDEIGALATAFNAMAEQIARSYQTLEEKVVERTKELASAQAHLEEKVSELERMNKLMVGRELAMIELKKRLVALETEKITV